MPFKSKAQRRKFAQLLVEGKITPETYEDWNRETGSSLLPERVRGAKKSARAKKQAVRRKPTTTKKATARTSAGKKKAAARARGAGKKVASKRGSGTKRASRKAGRSARSK